MLLNLRSKKEGRLECPTHTRHDLFIKYTCWKVSSILKPFWEIPFFCMLFSFRSKNQGWLEVVVGRRPILDMLLASTIVYSLHSSVVGVFGFQPEGRRFKPGWWHFFSSDFEFCFVLCFVHPYLYHCTPIIPYVHNIRSEERAGPKMPELHPTPAILFNVRSEERRLVKMSHQYTR